ncbi:hypothetical protein PENTCL1PPCAC_9375, partial [Pristionchus entomophagus]
LLLLLLLLAVCGCSSLGRMVALQGRLVHGAARLRLLHAVHALLLLLLLHHHVMLLLLLQAGWVHAAPRSCCGLLLLHVRHLLLALQHHLVLLLLMVDGSSGALLPGRRHSSRSARPASVPSNASCSSSRSRHAVHDDDDDARLITDGDGCNKMNRLPSSNYQWLFRKSKVLHRTT